MRPPRQSFVEMRAVEYSGVPVPMLISRFRRSEAIFFHKVMGKSTVTQCVAGPLSYQLEFPVRFLREHGNKFTENVTLERPEVSGKVWPLRITIRSFINTGKIRVFAYGMGGWEAFVKVNRIEVGDHAIFNLIGFSRFQVHVYHSSVLDGCDIGDEAYEPDEYSDEKSDRLTVHDETSSSASGSSERTPGLSSLSEQIIPDGRANSADDDIADPWFVKTLHLSYAVRIDREYVRKERLDVPASFWQRHRRLLQSRAVKLEGPICKHVMVVNRQTYTGSVQTRVQFEAGWRAFYIANKLRLGDKLLFSLIAPSHFRVQILDRQCRRDS